MSIIKALRKVTPGEHWIPFRIDATIDKYFCHNDYTELVFREKPTLKKLYESYFRLVHLPEHNFYKLVEKISENLDLHQKRKFLYETKQVLVKYQNRYSKWRLIFLLDGDWISNRADLYAAAKVRSKFLNILIKATDRRVMHLELNTLVTVENSFDFEQQNVEETLERVLSSLAKSTGTNPFSEGEFRKFIQWSNRDVQDFVVWALMPIVTNRATLSTGQKTRYLKMFGNLFGLDLSQPLVNEIDSKKHKSYKKFINEFLQNFPNYNRKE